MQAKDDSLKRWEQSELNNRIWSYFDSQVAKKIIFDGLDKKSTMEMRVE
jgi:hypothetical protein